MKTKQKLIHGLSQLCELDAAKGRVEARSARFSELTLEADGLRERMPAAILHLYDLRASRGRRGAAQARNSTCGGCHLALPSGQLADLRRDDTPLLVCGHCNILVLPEGLLLEDVAAVAAAASAAAAAAVVKKPRKTKAKVAAVLPTEADAIEADAAVPALPA